MENESVKDTLLNAIEEHKDDTSAEQTPTFDRTAPNSVRDSLENAFDELKDTNKLAERASRHLSEQKEVERETRGDPKPEPKQVDPDKPEQIPVKIWDKLSDGARDYYKKEYSELVAAKQQIQDIDELDAVFDEHPDTRHLSPAQRTEFAKRALHNWSGWLTGLMSHDPNEKLAALEDIASRAGIDLTQPPPASYYQQRDAYAQQQQAYLYQQQEQYNREVHQAAEKHKPTLANYAKNRPHFEKVKGHMASILAGMIQSGAISRDEDLSKQKYLDLAYNSACELAGLQNTRRGREHSERKQHGSNKIDSKSVRATLRRAFNEVSDKG